MKIGILKEPGIENRVALLPDNVKTLIDLKTTVAVEKGAGERSFSSDQSYIEKGAEIVDRDSILNNSDLIISIHPIGNDEYRKLKEGQSVLTALSPLINMDLVRLFVEKNNTTFSMDMVPRTTRAQSMDILSSMATVAGYKAVLEAANYLPTFFPMFMTAA